MLEEEDQALSCSLLSRFSEDIFIKLNKLFILTCNLDVLFQEDDMISKLNEKETVKKVAKKLLKELQKESKTSLIFQASLSLEFEDQCKSCIIVDL